MTKLTNRSLSVLLNHKICPVRGVRALCVGRVLNTGSINTTLHFYSIDNLHAMCTLNVYV